MHSLIRRVAFALGTVGSSVVSGEESFAIEWDDTDEVRFVVRAFDRPVSTLYRLDFTTCSLCGACVEVCPVDAIRFSRDYNLAGRKREDFQMDLLKNMKVKEP